MRASLICVVLAASETARADELGEARRLEATLEYDKALAIVDAAIAHGGADPAQLAELHRLAGELTAGLDRRAEAEDHFARALALRPAFALPPGTSPKLTAPFDAARARGPALRVHATSDNGVIAVVADVDPLGLVVGIAVRIIDAGGQHGEVIARTARSVALAAGTTAIEIAALDASGNRVWLGALPRDFPRPEVPVVEPSLLARPLPWAVATVALAAAGGVLAWKTSSLQSQWNAANDGMHDFSQLTALESRGKDYAIAADVAFGLTAVAAAATIVVYLRAPSHDTTRATVLVSPGAIGVSARF